GGITPGSFCPSARDSFDEGILIPPVKIVENMEIRKDVEDLYLRSSRKPEMVALDFRAQLAGNITARERVLGLIERYGPATVKGVMKRVLDISEQAFLTKMAKLPDGTWQDRTYIECCRPGDRKTYRVVLTAHKSGFHLTFENEGTAAQEGAMNATFSGWRGSVIVAINQLLCWDQNFAVGGALRHITFDPTPGTLNCARHPASVSTAPTQSMEISLYPAYNVLGKMIYASPDLRGDLMCIGGTSQWPATIFRGIDQWGERYGYLLVDPIGGAIGAFSTGDGISTGGQSRTPICKLPNIEHTEQTFPLLFLYRKEVPDSGGAGKFRGGLSAESCFIAHNTNEVVQDTLSSGNAIPTSTGMMGGYPATTNAYNYVTGSDIQARFKASTMINDVSEVAGERVTLQLRQENFSQTKDDVYAVMWTAGGGFGDPMERDPESVAADVDNLSITADAALDIYGVVLDPETEGVDGAATEKLRADIRAARVAKNGNGGGILKADGETLYDLTDALSVRENGNGHRYGCRKCATDLGPVGENYKSHCLQENSALDHANPLIGDSHRFIDDTPEFRQFFCPGCGTLIENEIAITGEDLLMDVHVAV
ncbi:MAG: hydantoinase B/oxoprolinase family protein, partial [Rhodospirillales bacterium]|nr:hydantoinase B/oxoprolinase family protein [Rhodospirillales bacterium]